jgi:hypothetical protein
MIAQYVSKCQAVSGNDSRLRLGIRGEKSQ